jgi:hypothetical protein
LRPWVWAWAGVGTGGRGWGCGCVWVCVCVCVPVPPPLTEEQLDHRPRAPPPARAALSWPPGSRWNVCTPVRANFYPLVYVLPCQATGPPAHREGGAQCSLPLHHVPMTGRTASRLAGSGPRPGAKRLHHCPSSWQCGYQRKEHRVQITSTLHASPRCTNLKQGPRRARLRGAPLPHSHNALVATSCSVLCVPPAGGPSGEPARRPPTTPRACLCPVV